MELSIKFLTILKYSTIILIVEIPFLISCSTCIYCTKGERLNIQYYFQGGITGAATGVSIDSSGTANFWNQYLNTDRKISKTIKVDKNKLKEICKLLEIPEVLTYKNNFVGNYTTYLIIKLGDKENMISFNKSELPDNMPEPLRLLISKLNIIEYE